VARYFQIIGPTANFSEPTSPTQIPQLTVTRFWDHGELLVSYAVNYSTGAAARFSTLRVRLDGADVMAVFRSDSLPASFEMYRTRTLIVPITEGIHTIALFISASVAGAIITANTSNLTVIQLPLWDSAANIALF